MFCVDIAVRGLFNNFYYHLYLSGTTAPEHHPKYCKAKKQNKPTQSPWNDFQTITKQVDNYPGPSKRFHPR
ncbi:hypothetical protein FACS189472_14340 [Alphaproteobacteria bacterium]|nr:hypothetical protein FACS189472_14340 [Alphaproteobacteria bacterium]